MYALSQRYVRFVPFVISIDVVARNFGAERKALGRKLRRQNVFLSILFISLFITFPEYSKNVYVGPSGH